MAWLLLFLAGIFEIIWAIALKYSDGWRKPMPSAVAIIGSILSIVTLSFALRTLPVGAAYAVWVGIGILGVALWGVLFFGESPSPMRIFCMFLIFSGIVGLKLVSN